MSKKIIYFTNALDQSSFRDYLSMWKVSPNLSNQNFHNKLIRAIALYNDVEVISVRAINSNFEKAKLESTVISENKVTWKYPKVTTSRVGKYLLLNSRIKKILSIDNSDSTILVDALNYSLVKEAYKLAKKEKIKVIGVCTDNPHNISFTNSLYKKKLFKYASKLDGYIVLTEGINKIYNKENKPYLLIEGVSEELDVSSSKLVEGKYIYFGGSLMGEYGVYNLIDAFNKLEFKDTKLVLCGHHLEKEKLLAKISKNPAILYLGPVSYNDNLSLIKGAILSVNPRPINPTIDDYSIPSKTLECLSLKCLNVTVKNNLLYEHYKDEIIWANSSTAEDLAIAIKAALSLSKKEKEKIAEFGYKKVMSRTSQKVIGKKISDFLS